MKIFSKLDKLVVSASPGVRKAYFRLRYKLSKNRVIDHGSGNGITVANATLDNVSVTLMGNNNVIYIKDGARLANLDIVLLGSGNLLSIGRDCSMGKGQIWFSQSDSQITIDDRTEITEANIAVTETGSSITIGKDGLFAWGIDIRCGDGHPIIDLTSGIRLNVAEPISIGDHVWLASNVQVLKSVSIGDNAIVGAHSVVTRNIPNHCLAVGIPAKVIRDNVTWLKDNDTRIKFDTDTFQLKTAAPVMVQNAENHAISSRS